MSCRLHIMEILFLSEAKKLPALASFVFHSLAQLCSWWKWKKFSSFFLSNFHAFVYLFQLSALSSSNKRRKFIFWAFHVAIVISILSIAIYSWEIYEIHWYYLHKLSASTTQQKNSSKHKIASIYDVYVALLFAGCIKLDI